MRVTKVDHVRRLLTNRPDLTPKEIAHRTKACISEVYQQRLKLRAFTEGTLPKVATAKVVMADDKIPVFKKQEEAKVDVTATPTYSEAFTNAVDLIAKHELNFNAGSALAHILKAKGTPINKIENLHAAIWYLNQELQHFKI
jgi:hypothetical protein